MASKDIQKCQPSGFRISYNTKQLQMYNKVDAMRSNVD